MNGWMHSHPGKTMTMYDILDVPRTAVSLTLKRMFRMVSAKLVFIHIIMIHLKKLILHHPP